MLISDNDRVKHPFLSDDGIYTVLMVESLDDESLRDLIKNRKLSASYSKIVKELSDKGKPLWARSQFFIISSAVMVAVRGRIMTEKQADNYCRDNNLFEK